MYGLVMVPTSLPKVSRKPGVKGLTGLNMSLSLGNLGLHLAKILLRILTSRQIPVFQRLIVKKIANFNDITDFFVNLLNTNMKYIFQLQLFKYKVFN